MSEGARAQVPSAQSGGAPRDPWRLVPSISVDETWSDNINLAPAGAETSDFVTTISPGLRLTRFGPRLTVNFNYNPQFLYYARGTGGSQIRNYLDASVTGSVIENFLFFDALVSVSQGNVSPFGTLAANTVNNSGNRAETRSYSLGPSIRSRVGSDLTYAAGYRFTGSTSNNDAYSASHTSTLYAQFESGTSFRNFGYGADISRSDQSFGELNSIVQETVGTTLTYAVTPAFRLRGRIGYDRNSYPTTGQPDLKGASYSGGFDWQPSRHTQVNAQVGHRYFGPTANISVRETIDRVSISARYSRDQTTSAASGLGLVADPNYALLDQIFRTAIPDTGQRSLAVVNALRQAGLPTSQFTTTSFLSNQLYLQKTLQLSIGLRGLRNTVSLTGSSSESQTLSAIDTGFDVFNQAQRFRTTTYSGTWSYRLGPRTNVYATVTKTRNSAIVGNGDTRQRQLVASVNRQIGRHLDGSVSYRNTVQTGDGQNNTINPFNNNFYSGSYRENAVYGSLRLTF